MTAADTSPPLLEARGLVKRYGGTLALRDVDLALRSGEIHALVGENGAGKSTLSRVLTGAVRPDGGELRIDGVLGRIRDPLDSRRFGFAMVHQHDTLVPHLSVAENILLGRLPRSASGPWIDWRAARARAAALLAEIGFPDLPIDRRARDLSATQRQLAEIAKAVADRPRLLIMDEPSASLAHEDVERMFAFIRGLRASGVAVLYISHRLDEVLALADRITVLKDGAVAGEVRPGETDKARLIRMMVGRPIEDLFPGRRGGTVEPALEVRALGRAGAFHDVSFEIGRGEIVGLYGLVGSGRTEVARCLFGADRATAGSIVWEGRPFAPRTPGDALRSGVALLTEDRHGDGLVLGLSTSDNASIASLREVSRLGVIRRGLMRERVAVKFRELAVRPADLDREVATLSGGNQQKVVLAKWLLTRSALLILDEPTRGVDVGAKRDIYELIGRLAEGGRSILFISSDLPEVLGMCDRVLVMRAGRIAGSFGRAEASEERVLACASGLEAAA